jgi:hypothetical protein
MRAATGCCGGLGLLGLVISVSAQITRVEAGHAPSHDLVGWPLALVAIGAVALLVSVLRPAFSARSSD